MQINPSMGDALGRYLDLASDQLKLTASNMANIDTPGYKTQGFDFEQEFRRQQSGLDPAGPQITTVDGLVARPDGNNVSMDREGLQLAQTQLKFKMGVELLKGQFSSVMTAIHAETK
ncbi:flagellar basal body rod protein FlgB [Granulicella arctica]|uniref:flagellar basal body rod protein FlgB n=1 Tax=Granulicella arctica TaxID=940613 RepID=UPI0021E09356|nr:flagellar basal body protein [Granulicella arctica]